jgi:threonine dehydratase
MSDRAPAPAPPALTLGDVRRAAQRLAPVVHRTPVVTSRALDERAGARVHLKCEGLQLTGAFKIRGAYNAVATLLQDGPIDGVCGSSAGNHAQALALAARLCATRAVILMPRDAPASKRAATEALGAEVVEYDRYADDPDTLQRELAQRRGLRVVHPYDDPLIMAGAGTVALELIEDATEPLDLLLVPVGGGGLIAGCATVAKALVPGIRVIGVEPEASASFHASRAAGERVRIVVGQTIADGQQLPAPGARTWPVVEALVDDVVTVSDAQIAAAMVLLFERVKVVSEPSGASALAALLGGALGADGRCAGVVLSGANVDARRFAAVVS